MLYRILIILQVVYTTVFLYKSVLVDEGRVLGADTIREDAYYTQITYKPEIVTTTAFDQKEVDEYETLPFNIVYEDDEDVEYGLEEIKKEGQNGRKTKTYLVTYWVDDVIDKTLISTLVTEPTTQIVSKGKKIMWKNLSTPEYGKIKYWYKLRVWATKYDSTCEGCNNTTALGAPVQQGVCAVDPTVINMYTHFYVPGYGKCQALDVGGAIKGNKIDLAYKDHRIAPWRTGYVDIYLMDNEPQ